MLTDNKEGTLSRHIALYGRRIFGRKLKSVFFRDFYLKIIPFKSYQSYQDCPRDNRNGCDGRYRDTETSLDFFVSDGRVYPAWLVVFKLIGKSKYGDRAFFSGTNRFLVKMAHKSRIKNCRFVIMS